MTEVDRYSFLRHLCGNQTRFQVLGALASRATEPPVPFAQTDIIEELEASGQTVYPSQVSNEVRSLVKWGLIDSNRDRHHLGARFTVPASPFWQAISQLVEAVDGIVPPDHKA